MSLMIERFVTRDERRALFASYLAKLGDERAIPMLKGSRAKPGYQLSGLCGSR